MRIFRARENILLILPAIAVFTAVTYGVVTYQTPYGCGSSGVASGPGIDWQVLAEPCVYVYFTGIVGGSVILILLIPVPEKKAKISSALKLAWGRVFPTGLPLQGQVAFQKQPRTGKLSRTKPCFSFPLQLKASSRGSPRREG